MEKKTWILLADREGLSADSGVDVRRIVQVEKEGGHFLQFIQDVTVTLTRTEDLERGNWKEGIKS